MESVITSVGIYELRRFLGKGATGDVWLATMQGTQTDVALKILRDENFKPNLLAGLKAEFALLSKLKHAHLAQIFHFGFIPEKRRHFIAAEYCPGQSFLEACSVKDISYFEKALVQVLAALDCIHSQGIIHFDIKSQNILVSDKDGEPIVKVLDFGWATQLANATTEKKGTPAYMAPEILFHSVNVDQRADLYSLGMLCFRALSGGWPFIENAEAAMQWHRHGDIPEAFLLNAEVPEYLREIIKKCLAKNPSERFSSARVLLHFLNLATHGKYVHTENSLTRQIPLTGPFVGRAETLQNLQEALLQTVGRKPEQRGALSQSFVLCGEFGIGKTRLLEELRHIVELNEIPIVRLDCERQLNQWSVFSQGLELTQAPELSLSIKEMDGTLLRRQRVEAVLAKASECPFCLFVDDVHNADSEFLQFLDDLLCALKREKKLASPIPLFVILTIDRATKTSENQNIVKWVDQGLDLEKINQADIAQYLEKIFGPQDLLQKAARLLMNFSGGLPWLVVEGLRYLAPQIFSHEAIDVLPSPPPMGRLYESRLQQLSLEEKNILTILALLARPVGLDGLNSLLEAFKPSMKVLSSQNAFIDNLKQHALIYVDAEKNICLASQVLVQELVKTLSIQVIKKVHHGIAKMYAQGDFLLPEEKAEHWEKAGFPEQAREIFLIAGKVYKQQGQILSAVKCFKKGSALATVGSPLWLENRLEVLRLNIFAEVYADAQQTLQELAEFPSVLREELAGWLSLKTGAQIEAREHFLLALNLCEPHAVRQQITLKNSLANLDLRQGHLAQAEALFLETQRLEETLPDDEKNKATGNNLGMVYGLTGRFDQAKVFFTKRLEKIGNVSDQIACLDSLGFVLLRAGKLPEAAQVLQKALALAEQSGALQGLFATIGNLITAQIKVGQYATSLELIKRVFLHQRNHGTLRDLAYNYLREASLLLILWQKEAALDALERGQKISEQTQDVFLLGWFALMTGYWQRQFGNVSIAQILFEKAQGGLDAFLQAWASFARADMAAEAEDWKQCQLILSEMTDVIPDEECSLNIELLRLRCALALQPSIVVDENETFLHLKQQCEQKNYPEILWQVHHAWGLSFVKNGDGERAQQEFSAGVTVIETLASGLPEEYQGRYRQGRSKIYQALKEGVSMVETHILSRILDVNKRLVSEHDPLRLLALIMDEAIALSGAEEGLLLTLNDQGGFETQMARNIQKEDLEMAHFSRSVAGQVVRSGKSVFSINAAQDAALSAFESVVAGDVKSIACVPLKMHNKITGVIYLAAEQKERAIERSFMPMLEAFAEQASLALKNAWQFREQEKDKVLLEQSLTSTRQALEEKEIELQNLEHVAGSRERKTFFKYDKIIGHSKKIQDILQVMDKITNAKVSVYILGETGTGKELVARALHQNSHRQKRNFIAINCSAFTETILESELFGYQKGSFTGAERDKKGLFEAADQGTVFLDEVADMSLTMQAKVLRVIQEQEVMRVGGHQPIKIDTRLVCASNRDLAVLVREGKFREDLYFRLTGITLRLPPLRERKEDLPLLINHLLAKITHENGLEQKPLLQNLAMQKLLAYDWPGNIRELEQSLTNAALLCEGGKIKAETIPLQNELYKKDSGAGPADLPSESFIFAAGKTLADYEKEIILMALAHWGGNKSETAKALGISRLTLHKKLRAYLPPLK